MLHGCGATIIFTLFAENRRLSAIAVRDKKKKKTITTFTGTVVALVARQFEQCERKYLQCRGRFPARLVLSRCKSVVQMYSINILLVYYER